MADVRAECQRPGASEARSESSEGKRPTTDATEQNKAMGEGTAFPGNFAQAMALSALFGGFSPSGMPHPFVPFLSSQMPWNGADYSGSPRQHNTNSTILAPVAKPAVPANRQESKGCLTMGFNEGLREKKGSLFVPYRQGEKRKLPSDEPPQDGNKPKSMRGTSKYRGVTRHRRSGRWEAHIWVPETNRQLYLGGYKLEEDAATAYDIVAIKCKGIHSAKANFPKTNYNNLLQLMQKVSLEEIIMAVRRQSEGFSTCKNPLLPGKYVGVRRAKDHFEAFLSLPGSPEIYLGQFKTEEAAARAVDRSLIRIKGNNAQINFSIEEYPEEMAEYLRRKDANNSLKPEEKEQPSNTLRPVATQTCETTEVQPGIDPIKTQAKGA